MDTRQAQMTGGLVQGALMLGGALICGVGAMALLLATPFARVALVGGALAFGLGGLAGKALGARAH